MLRASIGLACILTLSLFTTAQAADLAAIADANTDSSAPGVNLGSNGVLAVSGGRIGLIRFSAASISQSTGSTGTLQVKVLLTKNSSNAISVRLVTSAWDERTVTFNNRPTFSDTPLDQKIITSATQGKLVTFNVSAALAAWRSNPSTNFGLALVAATPAPNLQLGSREGGGAATISTSSTVVADNDVTVGSADADYPDPATAASNARQGDHWCVSPQPTRPCTIHIAAGLYVGGLDLEDTALIGEEKGETILLGGVDAHGALTISDLTLTGGISLVVPGSSGSRIALHLERVGVRGAISTRDATEITFIDSDITCEADGDVLCLDYGNPSNGGLTLLRTRLTAISRQGSAQVIDSDDALSGAPVIRFEDSSLSAWGKLSAAGFVTGDEWVRDMTMLRTNIDVASPGTAVAISGGDHPLHIINSHISAHGGQSASGVHWASRDTILDGVTIDATTEALFIGADFLTEPGMATVLRSQLTAGKNALATYNSAVNVEDSILTGPNAVFLTYISKLAVSSSQLAGAVTLFDEFPDEGLNSATCDHVFDASLALLPAHCTKP